MKSFLKPFQLLFLFMILGIVSATAHQRIIKGTVYLDGKPAKGVKVTAHKTKDSYFTSFDGKYELRAELKTRWIKFSFTDKEIKLDIDPKSDDYIDCVSTTKNSAAETTNSVKQNLNNKLNDTVEKKSDNN